MKKLIITLFTAFLCTIGYAQHAPEATKVLDEVSSTWATSTGMQIDFTGTIRGVLQMKEQKFRLTTSQMEYCYDGKTLWSYSPKDKEVIISTPTSKEMILINPYFLLHNYKQTFKSAYGGRKRRENQMVHIITLTPKQKDELRSVILYINDQKEPTYLKITLTNGQMMEVRVKNIRRNKSYNTKDFTFESEKNKKLEIIDLR